MEIRKRVLIASVKIFYRPDEAAKQFGISEEVLLKIAISVGAVYKIGYIYLVNIMDVAGAVARYKEFTEKREGAYVRTLEAVKELGLPEELVLYIASKAHALYEVGGEKLIDIKEANTYILKAFRLGQILRYRNFPKDLEGHNLSEKYVPINRNHLSNGAEQIGSAEPIYNKSKNHFRRISLWQIKNIET